MLLLLIFCFNSQVIAQSNTKKKPTNTVKKANPAIEQGRILISRTDCLSCHKPAIKLIGPSFHDIALKYAPTDENYALLIQKVIKGGSGNWGPMAMSPHAGLSDAEVKKMIDYILSFK